MAKRNLPLVILIIAWLTTQAQEHLTGLTVNPHLPQKAQISKKNILSEPLSLPFFDDFSTYMGYPTPSKWSDSAAYINQHLVNYGISIGVATLDATDSNGRLYPLGFGQIYRPGDSLTSRAINLSGLSPADSVYLSFFYMPGGLADLPQTGDSLLVDFWDGQQWRNTWKTSGNKPAQWKQVLLPITETSYFSDTFRFRFRNIISPSGGGIIATNCDFWHIDYVKLDKNRHHNDTIIRDVTITRPPNFAFRQYSFIPWRHYQSYFYLTYGTIDFYFANHDNNNNQNITSYYKISNPFGTYKDSVLVGAMNYEAFEQIEFSAPINRNLFPLNNNDSAVYLLETKIIASSMYPTFNNTGQRYHIFSNYYAYDDGTAENGYDLNQAGGRVAVKFEMYAEDSLRGVYIYFNPTNDSAYLTNYFTLCVWQDNGGIPGQLIYSKPGCTPRFNYEGHFSRILLDTAIFLPKSFFIGYQKNTNQFMSVGLDMSRQIPQRNFYNLGQQWVASAYPYPLMIRPIVSRNQIVGINSQPSQTETPNAYPNPATTNLYISYPDPIRKWHTTLLDMTGRVKYEGTRPEFINCQTLDNGLYIIRFTEGRETTTQKIIINR